MPPKKTNSKPKDKKISKTNGDKAKTSKVAKNSKVTSLDPNKFPGSNVVIVESPNKNAKITSILQNLGLNNFVVTASYGHIRQIDPHQVGIDINNNFKPHYVVDRDGGKQEVVFRLREAIRNCDKVWLAADQDREGESIAWHLKEVLKLKDDEYERIVFTEITQDAIGHCLQNPRKIDYNMSNAQQARSVMDKLIGYMISPLLSRQYNFTGLSAGRVQSVALKLIVEREKEIEKFTSHGYFQIVGNFQKDKVDKDKKDKKGLIKLADGFGGEMEGTIPDIEQTKSFLELVPKATFKILDGKSTSTLRKPPAPLTTSTLQQDASTKLHISPGETMSLAQTLYEKGLITYMRTDSVALSEEAMKKIKDKLVKDFGEEYHQKTIYKNKDNSQEAHEACRPSDFNKKVITDDKDIGAKHQRLYNMILERTLASQMPPAKCKIRTVKIGMDNSDKVFVSKAEKIEFDGYLRLRAKHGDGSSGDGDDEEESEDEIKEDKSLYKMLSTFKKDDVIYYQDVTGTEKFSKPPHPRYTEAGLIKDLEKKKIGRPSTWANILNTLVKERRNRNFTGSSSGAKGKGKGKKGGFKTGSQKGEIVSYVAKKNKEGEKKPYSILECRVGETLKETQKEIKFGGEKQKLFPSVIGTTIVGFLDDKFSKIMEYGFTARVEDMLDDIASGKQIWHNVVKIVYDEFNPQIENLMAHLERKNIEKYLGMDPVSKRDVCIVVNDYGFSVVIKGSGDIKSRYCSIKPEEFDHIGLEKALTLFKYPVVLGKDKDNKKEVILNRGRHGYYLSYDGKNYNLDSYFKGSSDDDSEIDQDKEIEALDAKKALTYIKSESGKKQKNELKVLDPRVKIMDGPYGPYISYKGKLNVKIPKDKDPMKLTYKEAATLINQKKLAQEGGRAGSKGKGKSKPKSKKE